MSTAVMDAPELPSLASGVTFLKTDGRATGPLQSIVLDHLLTTGADAIWVDARGNAVTRPLLEVAPNRRILQRIRVARAFTPFQHYSLLDDVPEHLDAEVELVVLPSVDWFYHADELRHGEGEEMLADGLRRLSTLAAERDLPVLLTESDAGESGPADLLAEYSDTELECEFTPMGPRFVTGEFETLVYHEDGYIQTTLAFWREVLRDRHAIRTTPTTGQEVPLRGTH